MSERIEKINEILRSEIAQYISREIGAVDYLVTVCYVNCSNDLKNATVGISVLPDNRTGSALSRMKAMSSGISNTLKKKMRIKFIPRLRWSFDETEKKAAVIEEILDQIKQEEK